MAAGAFPGRMIRAGSFSFGTPCLVSGYRATVTQATARFARADATEILRASPDRVPAPCRYARPGGCGGCDWQHVSLPAQRALKAVVIRQQLSRIGGLDREVEVVPVGGDETGSGWRTGPETGLGWRTVVSFAIDRSGRPGLRRHRSHEIVPVEECLIAHDADHGRRRDRPPMAVSCTQWRSASSPPPANGAFWSPAPSPRAGFPRCRLDTVALARKRGSRIPVRGRGYLTQQAAGRDWRVSLGGFWQVHPRCGGHAGGGRPCRRSAAARRDRAGPLLRRRPVRRRAGGGGRPGGHCHRHRAGSGRRPGRPAQPARLAVGAGAPRRRRRRAGPDRAG